MPELKFFVRVCFIETYRDSNMVFEFTVVSDNIQHAYLKALNYLKSLGLDSDLVEYFSIELL